MLKEALSLSVIALMVSTACYAQTASGNPAPEEVTVSAAGLYGDWKMVLPEWPGAGKPVVGDFCNFKQRGDAIAITCADDFLQDIPEVTFNADKLRLRWGGALNHTIYDAVLVSNGNFQGEIVQAQMGLVAHRFKTNMERVPDSPGGTPSSGGPPASLAALRTYAARAHPNAEFTVKYFGPILEDKGHGATFPDVFKISNAANAEQWCLVLVNAGGPADVRCHDIP